MIKKRVKEVFYKVWEECEFCNGKRISHHSNDTIITLLVCEDCGNEREHVVESPRIITEYEEIYE